MASRRVKEGDDVMTVIASGARVTDLVTGAKRRGLSVTDLVTSANLSGFRASFAIVGHEKNGTPPQKVTMLELNC